MSARILDGKAVARSLREELREALRGLPGVPGLGVVLAGDDPGSLTYVRHKTRDAEEVGMRAEVVRLPEEASQGRVVEAVEGFNRRPDIHGIVVQLPLPSHLQARAILDTVDPAKDVDGLHPLNVGRLALGQPGLVPATPRGILELLRRARIELEGRHAVVVGRSDIVGKPVAQLLLQAHCTVTLCHSRTHPLEEHTLRADILVVAIGRPRHIGPAHVKPGAAVIDVGIHRLPDGGLCGDVDFQAVREVAGAITPVPGGVGPLTRAMLLVNTMQAYRVQVQ